MKKNMSVLIKKLKRQIGATAKESNEVSITWKNLNIYYRKQLYFMVRGALSITGLDTGVTVKIDYFNNRGSFGEPHYLKPVTYTQNGEYELFFKIPLDFGSTSTICTNIFVYDFTDNEETLVASATCDFDYTENQVAKTINLNVSDNIVYCDTVVVQEDGTELAGEDSPVKVRQLGNDPIVTQLINKAIEETGNAKAFINYIYADENAANDYSDVDFFEQCTNFKVLQIDSVSDKPDTEENVMLANATLVFNMPQHLIGTYHPDSEGRAMVAFPMIIDISNDNIAEWNDSCDGPITLDTSCIDKEEDGTKIIQVSGISVQHLWTITQTDDNCKAIIILMYQ